MQGIHTYPEGRYKQGARRKHAAAAKQHELISKTGHWQSERVLWGNPETVELILHSRPQILTCTPSQIPYVREDTGKGRRTSRKDPRSAFDQNVNMVQR